MNYFRKRLRDACAHGVCLLQGALWVKKYLEKKIAYLEENPTKKVGIGQSKLNHNHIYIIQKLLEFINNVITEEAIDDLFKTIDVNGNGKISYSEFCNYIRLDMVESKNISENEFYQQSPDGIVGNGYLPSEGTRIGVISGRMFDEVAKKDNNEISLIEFKTILKSAKKKASSKDWIRFYSFHERNAIGQAEAVVSGNNRFKPKMILKF